MGTLSLFLALATLCWAANASGVQQQPLEIRVFKSKDSKEPFAVHRIEPEPRKTRQANRILATTASGNAIVASREITDDGIGRTLGLGGSNLGGLLAGLRGTTGLNGLAGLGGQPITIATGPQAAPVTLGTTQPIVTLGAPPLTTLGTTQPIVTLGPPPPPTTGAQTITIPLRVQGRTQTITVVLPPQVTNPPPPPPPTNTQAVNVMNQMNVTYGYGYQKHDHYYHKPKYDKKYGKKYGQHYYPSYQPQQQHYGGHGYGGHGYGGMQHGGYGMQHGGYGMQGGYGGYGYQQQNPRNNTAYLYNYDTAYHNHYLPPKSSSESYEQYKEYNYKPKKPSYKPKGYNGDRRKRDMDPKPLVDSVMGINKKSVEQQASSNPTNENKNEPASK